MWVCTQRVGGRGYPSPSMDGIQPTTGIAGGDPQQKRACQPSVHPVPSFGGSISATDSPTVLFERKFKGGWGHTTQHSASETWTLNPTLPPPTTKANVLGMWTGMC